MALADVELDISAHVADSGNSMDVFQHACLQAGQQSTLLYKAGGDEQDSFLKKRKEYLSY